MEGVKEKPLKQSGSCPQIGKLLTSRADLISNRSSTFLARKSPERKMRRVGGGGAKRVCHNQIQVLDKSFKGQHNNQQEPPLSVEGKPLVKNLFRSCGDVLDCNAIYCPSPTNDSKETPELHAAESSSSCGESLGVEKRHIDVIVRIRPKTKSEEISKTIVWKTSDTTLLFDPKEKDADFFYKGRKQGFRNDFGKKRPNKNLPFGFDFVFGQDSSNEEIFEFSLKSLINKVLAGFNCTVFAYGATGSGKTYTMLGSTDTPGITVLMAEELFRRLNGMESDEFSHDITVSYLEVYNETIKDLLNPNKELSIREDGKQGLRIPQLTVHKPQCPQELLTLLRDGNSARSQHATDFNSESSRSHAVFEITVLMHQHSRTQRFKKRTATSRLFMVDLAGSEKGSVNTIDGLRQREGANINKSLLALSNCINALADGKTHIPYRNSKLTRLLKDSLSGNCVTVMIANVSPADNTFEDTHNTLYYAKTAKNIKVTCKQNAYSEELVEESECRNRISDLQNEVRILTQQLADERRKHQKTRELLEECPVGDGDGFGIDSHSSTSSHRKQVCKLTHDPSAAKQLVDLITEKTDLMTNLTEASVNVRLHEWEMNWKKLQVDVAECVGRLEVTDPQFISITKLMNNQSDLVAQFPTLSESVTEKQKNLKKLNFQIANVHQTFLNRLKPDAPFLTVSFEEFISHKQMDMEIKTMEKLLRFQQNLTENLFGELKNVQIHRIQLLKFVQKLAKMQEKRLFSKEVEKNLHAILSPTYELSIELEPPTPQKRFNFQEDFLKLHKTIYRPVVTFPKNEFLWTKSSLPHLPQIESSVTIFPVSSQSSTFQNNDTSGKDSTDEEDGQLLSVRSYKPTKGSRPAPKKNSPKFLQSIVECSEGSNTSNNYENKRFVDSFVSSDPEGQQLCNISEDTGSESHSFEKLQTNKRDNNKASASTKSRGKEKETKETKKRKSITPFVLRRGKAVTDITIEEASNPDKFGPSGNVAAAHKHTRCRNVKQKDSSPEGKKSETKVSNIPKRIPLTRTTAGCNKKDSGRPFTFKYEDGTSTSSFDSFG